VTGASKTPTFLVQNNLSENTQQLFKSIIQIKYSFDKKNGRMHALVK